MTMKAALLAALAALTAADATDDQKKEADAKLRSFIDDSGEDGEEKKTDAASEGEEKCAEGDDSSDKDEDKDKETKTEANAHAAKKTAAVDVAAENVELTRRVDHLEIQALIDKRSDLSESVRKWCLTEDPAVVRRFLGKVDKVHAVKRNASPTQPGHAGPEQLEGVDREFMDRSMGVTTHNQKAIERRSDGTLVLHATALPDSAKKGA